MADTNERPVAVTFNAKGNPVATSTLSPEKNQCRASFTGHPDDVYPIIFIPGIMGTNIKMVDTDTGKVTKSWYPPNGKIAGLKEVKVRKKQTAAQRQIDMDPKKTQVGYDGLVKLPKDFPHLDMKEALRRGWGSVHWDGYGGLLIHLEQHLNEPFNAVKKAGIPPEPTDEWQKIIDITVESLKITDKDIEVSPLAPLTGDEHKKIGKNYFPVYACGYNWIRSNEDSAQAIAKTLGEIEAWYKKSDCYTFKKFILVTHSMGGLVARRLAQLAEDKIAGVVHGVQPVNGAPAVYRRFVAGTEGSGLEALVAIVIGRDPEDVTAVLASSAGGLELLPNKVYNKGEPWLHIHGASDSEPYSLPTKGGDPYDEIYGKQGVWWEMVTESMIDPAKIIRKKQIVPFQSFKDNLELAEIFHDQVNKEGIQYHPCTYGHYGNDKKQKSFGSLTWKPKNPTSLTSLDVAKLRRFNNEDLEAHNANDTSRFGSGKKDMNDYEHDDKRAGVNDPQLPPVAPETEGLSSQRSVTDGKSREMIFVISDKDTSGDGTVPYQSGAGLLGKQLKQVFTLNGFDHAGSYTNKNVRKTTLYSIAKILQQV